MDEDEIRLSYLFWRNLYTHKQEDEIATLCMELPKMPWLRRAREALFLKSETVAEKLGLSRTSYSRLERDETLGKLKISQIQEAAAAMDCELVYIIRPKPRKTFSQMVWPQIYPDLLTHHWLAKCDPQRKAGALAYLAQDAMLSAKFRRAKGWCRKIT